MQDAIQHEIVIVLKSGCSLTARTLKKSIAKMLRQRQNQPAHANGSAASLGKHGKMTVKELAAQNKGLQSIEVTDENIGSFNRVARKYGIDFAPYKARGSDNYLVFFKSADADAMTAAFSEYTSQQLLRRPSVLKKLRDAIQQSREQSKNRTRNKEHDIDR